MVIPEISIEADEFLHPWRIEVEDSVFAVDLLHSIPIDRLLETVGRAPAGPLEEVRRAIRHIV